MAIHNFILIFILSSLTVVAQSRDYPIKPVPFTSVKVDSTFWSPRMKTNRETTVGYCFSKSEQTGRIANFEVATGKSVCPTIGSTRITVRLSSAYTITCQLK